MSNSIKVSIGWHLTTEEVSGLQKKVKNLSSTGSALVLLAVVEVCAMMTGTKHHKWGLAIGAGLALLGTLLGYYATKSIAGSTNSKIRTDEFIKFFDRMMNDQIAENIARQEAARKERRARVKENIGRSAEARRASKFPYAVKSRQSLQAG